MRSLAVSAAVLALLGVSCTEHRIAPGGMYELLGDGSRVEITNRGPGDVRVESAPTENVKHPRITERTLPPGGTYTLLCGWSWGMHGPLPLHIEVHNPGAWPVTVAVRERPLTEDERRQLTRAAYDALGQRPRGTEGGPPAPEGARPSTPPAR